MEVNNVHPASSTNAASSTGTAAAAGTARPATEAASADALRGNGAPGGINLGPLPARLGADMRRVILNPERTRMAHLPCSCLCHSRFPCARGGECCLVGRMMLNAWLLTWGNR